MIDGYAHLGMPRFWKTEDYAALMTAMGITRAMVCPFDCCPDIAECHTAMQARPEAFRGFGLALGKDRAEIEAGMRAQLAAGFDGFRFSDQFIADQPWLLDVAAAEKAIPMVVGSMGLAKAAPHLLRYLDGGSDTLVVSPHCAGPTDPSVLQGPGPVADLFRHPRFVVVVSRHGIFDPKVIERWVGAMVEVVGWSRLMFGTEAPIPYWRDEVMTAAPTWIERYKPTAEQKARFFTGTGEHFVFSRPRRPVGPLLLPYDPFAYEVKTPAPMFPFGLPTDTSLPGELVRRWQAGGGEEKEPLSRFVSRVLARGLRGLNDDARAN